MEFHRAIRSADAAVIFISGQSNAHAHAQKLPEDALQRTPLSHVHTLDRVPNQTFEPVAPVWSGFTSFGKNLGETQDGTASFAYYFSRIWESAICRGAALPDLYLVQLSVGAQGISSGMWNLRKPHILRPGPLGTVDISLFPLQLSVFGRVTEDIRSRFRSPLILGWHWIGSEQDTLGCGLSDPQKLADYDTFFDATLAALGQPCPLYLYKNVFWNRRRYFRDNAPLWGIDDVNGLFVRQTHRLPLCTVVETDASPLWQPETRNNGIFDTDLVHYLPETQQWFAGRAFDEICAGL